MVEYPMIIAPSRTLDYGGGFYATTSERQAREWAARRMMEKRKACGYVNVYEFDEKVMSQLKSLVFGAPTEEWVKFVMANRTSPHFKHDYDIVYGPVANDKVYAQFALYEEGLIGVETLIRELKTYKLVDQYLFHTDKALKALRFTSANKILH